MSLPTMSTMTPNEDRQRRAGTLPAKKDAASRASAARMGWASGPTSPIASSLRAPELATQLKQPLCIGRLAFR